jgi:hypothetical protein
MPADLASLKRLLARTALRVRVQRGLETACWAFAAATTVAAVWLVLSPGARWTLPAAVAITSLSFLLGASRRVAGSLVSATIDRVGRLEGRVQAAHDFMHDGAARQSPFVEAALRDAVVASSRVLPAQAAPLHRPRATWLALIASLLCLGSSTRSVARAPGQRVASSSGSSHSAQPALLFRADELALREENARALHVRTDTGVDLQRQLAGYQALLAELRAGTLNQEAAVQRALALEAKLAASTRVADPADEATLRTLTHELTKAAPELARALSQGALHEAAAALHALAEKLRDEALDVAQRARLRAALQQARERERERAADRAREQELESLLRNNRKPDEPSLLKRRSEQQRELEKLTRKQAARPRRHLDKLTRELARAGSALSTGAADEAQDALDQAADALEQYEGEQHDEEARRELARELAQLRELLQQKALSDEREQRDPQQPGRGGPQARQPQQTDSLPNAHSQPEQSPQGDDAKARRERLQRFDLSARGRAGELADGGSEPGFAAGNGAGAEQHWLVVEQRPSRSVVVATPAEGGGSEHDPQQLDTPTRSSGLYDDRALSGVSGPGPSRSQVIRSAAQSGFVSAPYRKVYRDYRAHEEAWLERDDVPAGYRFHVRRYFELVRPREQQEERP